MSKNKIIKLLFIPTSVIFILYSIPMLISFQNELWNILASFQIWKFLQQYTVWMNLRFNLILSFVSLQFWTILHDLFLATIECWGWTSYITYPSRNLTIWYLDLLKFIKWTPSEIQVSFKWASSYSVIFLCLKHL